MYSVRVAVDAGGDRGLFERVSKRLRNPRPAMEMIGHYGVAQAQTRLNTVLKPDPVVRAGDLQNSLAIFDLGDDGVTWGSNLVYAAQVHHGGIIEPRNAKALAIPLIPQLQRYHLGPLDIDPGRDFLQFVPITSGKPNVFGVLVNPEENVETSKRRKGKAKKRGQLAGYPPGPLYALAYWVSQEPRPYLYVDDEDVREIVTMVAEYVLDG